MSLGTNPFAILTFIAAPALLTNASSVLAMSTINRMLRTRDRMAQLLTQSEKAGLSDEDSAQLLVQVDRIELQAAFLLKSLHGIYLALGSFAGATLVSLIGAGLQALHDPIWFQIFGGIGLFLGCAGIGGLIYGSINLFHATRLSLISIREEANIIRHRQAQRKSSS